MLRVTPTIVIEESELEERFVRSSGPGGQNVNKVATAVQLRFDVSNSPAIGEDVRRRLRLIAGTRMTADGVVVIDARRFRTQADNREDARERLADLIRRASVAPKRRRKTKPTASSKERRLSGKRRHSDTKRSRRSVGGDE